MSLFGRKKLSEEDRKFIQEEISKKKMIVGVSPELVNEVKAKVKKLKEEKEMLRKDYYELMDRMSIIEGKCDALEGTFKNFRGELKKVFLEDARSALEKEGGEIHSKLVKLEGEVNKIKKTHDDFEYVSSFQDYYQLIKLCIYLITNASPNDYNLIKIIIGTIHSLINDMKRNNFWETGKDAIITSLLNLKSYWRSHDEKIAELIGNEINALQQS